jgi:DUF4097 and DUF4098 domain-containing protein YvlB
MKRALTALVLAAATAAGYLWADVPVNEKRSVSPEALVELEMISGTVRITGTDRSEVEVTGDLGDERLKLEVSGGKDHLTIEIRYPDHMKNSDGDPDLEIRVPRRCRLEVDTVSAPVTLSELASRVDIESVSGNLTLKGSPREAKLSTVSGEISIEDGASLEEAEVNTVSGTIRAGLKFRSGGSFSFESVSGSIDLRLPSGVNADFEISTFSGSIVSDFGEKPARTSSILPSQELNFSTGSGGARVSAHSFSGSVKVRKEKD